MARKKQAVPVLTRERKGSPYRHFDFEVDGQRHTGSTKCLIEDVAGAEKVALAIRNRLLDEAAAKRVTFVPTFEDNDMTWVEAVASYLEFKGPYPSYAREEGYFAWLKPRIGDLSVKAIDDAKLTGLIAERRRKRRYDRPKLATLSNSAVNGSVTFMVQRVLLHARRNGVHLPREPYWRLHILPVAPRKREMVIDEEVLLEPIRPDIWPCIQFILETGLRKREALILKSQVHWRQGVIHVTGKGKKFHEVPITEAVAEILKKEWHKHPTHVFTYQAQVNSTHSTTKRRYVKGEYRPLIYTSLNDMFGRLCKRGGVSNLRVHDIRKTTGARIVRSTGDLKAAAKVLNHASVAMTDKHYSHITPADVRKRLLETSAETRRLKAAWVPGMEDAPTGQQA